MTPIVLVAEAAQGFEGRELQADLLIRAAAAGGADVIKFQLVVAEELAVPAYRYYRLFQSLEMDDEAWERIAFRAQEHGIALAFDVFGERSLALATKLGARAIKLHSTDFFNERLVTAALASGLDVWFSIGGVTWDEVDEFLLATTVSRPGQLTLLYGFQAEPTQTEDNHISRLGALRRRFPELHLGFMDHAAATTDESSWLGVLALPYGIRLIEKHITIGPHLTIEDDVSALDAAGFSRYRQRIRIAEAAIGSADAGFTPSERAYRDRVLKRVVSRRPLEAGRVLRADDLELKRTEAVHGTVLLRLADAIGLTLIRDCGVGEAIVKEALR